MSAFIRSGSELSDKSVAMCQQRKMAGHWYWLTNAKVVFRFVAMKVSIFTGTSALIGICYSGLWARREAAHQHDAVLLRQPHHGAACGVVADNRAIPNQMHGTQVVWINKAEVVAIRRDPPRSEDDRGFAPRDSDGHAFPIAVRFIATRRATWRFGRAKPR